jgi:hypothetical protein
MDVLKDPGAGFKQRRYIESYFLIGKQTCIRNSMDRLDILSTYLPLFPPLRGEVMIELTDSQKATVLYDALPHYCIKNMKEANTEPIKMTPEALFQIARNIEEAAFNPGKDYEAKTQRPKPHFLESTGV